LSNGNVDDEAAWWRGQAAGIPPKAVAAPLVLGLGVLVASY
jgi:hypothetical protein